MAVVRHVLELPSGSAGAGGVLGKLAKLGFPEAAFAGVLTSGEIAQARLAGRRSGGWFWEELGSRCLHMTWSARGAISLDGLGLDVRQASAWKSVSWPVRVLGVVPRVLGRAGRPLAACGTLRSSCRGRSLVVDQPWQLIL